MIDEVLSNIMDKGADVIEAITGLYVALYSCKEERIKVAIVEWRRAVEAMGAAVDDVEEGGANE